MSRVLNILVTLNIALNAFRPIVGEILRILTSYTSHRHKGDRRIESPWRGALPLSKNVKRGKIAEQW